MKELQTKTAKPKTDRTKAKVIVRIRTKAPAGSSPQIPILACLSKNSDEGVPTKIVIQEVSVWFGKLTDDDLNARYPLSKRKIVATVIKYAKKTLTIKGEVYPVGEGSPIGVWKITPRGQERLAEKKNGWSERYSVHDAILIEEEKN